MPTLNIVICLICAIGIASGQVLIKGASVAWNQAGTLLNISVVIWIGCAFFIYGVASLGWLYILKGVPLSAAYPFLAVTFLLVPVAGYLFFDENLGWLDGVAALLIISGICLVSLGRASNG